MSLTAPARDRVRAGEHRFGQPQSHRLSVTRGLTNWCAKGYDGLLFRRPQRWPDRIE
jgi:hypothetical protein